MPRRASVEDNKIGECFFDQNLILDFTANIGVGILVYLFELSANVSKSSSVSKKSQLCQESSMESIALSLRISTPIRMRYGRKIGSEIFDIPSTHFI